MNLKIEKHFLIILTSFIIYISYFYGFYINENSIGSGGYKGDLSWMWKNFEIFKNNTLVESIKSPNFFGNRSPLIYILHIIFNPWIYDIYLYRLSSFFVSFSSPVIFYLCLRKVFSDVDKYKLILIASLILLSPYFRSNAYWGGEIQYGIFSSLVSIYFLLKLKLNKNLLNNNYISLFLITFFSSLCVYFDQKLILIPIICLSYILKSNIKIKYKIFTLIFYFFLSLPFLWLVFFLWKGLVPLATQIANAQAVNSLKNFNLHFYNLIYATPIIAFYLLPILFFENKLIKKIKFFLFSKFFLYSFVSCAFFIICLVLFYNFEQFTDEKQYKFMGKVYGLGFSHKLSYLLFEKFIYRQIFVYVIFLISSTVIIFFFKKSLIFKFFIIYFYIISLLVLPLMQEYFDPYIFIYFILFYKGKLDFKNSKIYFIFSYFSFFLLTANIYYKYIS
jgi:hypothetical protein